MNISFGASKGAQESGKFLSSGIHNAKFMGIGYDKVTTNNGDEYNVMVLKLDVEGFGEFNHNFFEPTSNERQEMAWGPSASQLDHFLIAVREILEALNPQLITDLDEGKLKLDGTFRDCVKNIKKATDPYVNQEVQIKLLPNNKGFNSIPSFVAGISKNGNLTIRTRFIGHDLTLNDRELKMIEAAKTAAPTDMKKSSIVEDMQNSLDSDNDSDDLPF